MVTEVHCSQLARPMVCAGFLSFEDLPRFESGPAAEEGTAASEYLERLLMRQPIPAQARNGVYFNDEMKFHLEPLATGILSKAQGDVACETVIDWQTRSGIWVKGRYDLSFVRDNTLYVDDLKYGWGIVEVKENWQLIGYAIGEIIRRGQAFNEIVLRIHQPRPHHEDGSTREWRLSYANLLDYKERIERRFEEIAAGHRTLTTGAACKYCSAAAEACPAFNRLFYRGVEISTEFTQDQIDETTLARQLEQASRAAEAIKIKLDSLTELANMRIKGGKVIPGYVTESRYGDRKWKPGITPQAIEMLTGKKIIEEVMLSPAKVEKLGIPRDFVNSLVDRQYLGQKLVKKDHNELGNKIFGNGAPK